MSDDYIVRAASARLGGLSSYGRTPDPEEEAAARRVLATARVDRELRDTMRNGVRFDDLQVAHLTGLLLSAAGVKYDAATHIEGIVRNAVSDAQAQRSRR